MTTVTVVAESSLNDGACFRAISNGHQSVGRSVGEALDALDPPLGADPSTVVIVRRFGPDEFFTAEQTQRLQDLMSRWRVARDEDGPRLSADEQRELEASIAVELEATGRRCAAIADRIGL